MLERVLRFLAWPRKLRHVASVEYALAVAAWMVAGSAANAQGTIYFNNRVLGSVDAPIFATCMTLASGDEWWAQLYAAPAGSPSSMLVAVGPAVNFRTGNAAGYVISPGEVTLPNVAPGARAQIELRVWAAPFGSYEAARAAWAPAGASASFESLPLGGFVDGAPPIPGPPLIGLTTATAIMCPEPSTWVLGLMGVAAFVARFRRTSRPTARCTAKRA